MTTGHHFRCFVDVFLDKNAFVLLILRDYAILPTIEGTTFGIVKFPNAHAYESMNQYSIVDAAHLLRRDFWHDHAVICCCCRYLFVVQPRWKHLKNTLPFTSCFCWGGHLAWCNLGFLGVKYGDRAHPSFSHVLDFRSSLSKVFAWLIFEISLS